MESLYNILKSHISQFFKDSFGDIEIKDLSLQPTNKDHNGNITLLVFPLAKLAKLNPDVLAGQIGEYLSQTEYVDDYEVVRGFLNIKLSLSSWNILLLALTKPSKKVDRPQKIVLEYCGPNTNKPLHIGHLRNMFLGYGVAEVLKAAGHEVHKVNIFNDRGIAICKSLVAYQLYGNHATPNSENMKGDFFVGTYYVKFNEVLEREKEELEAQGIDTKDAESQAPIMIKANEVLLQWEEGDAEVMKLWHQMNDWFYEGVRETYRRLNIDTEKDYYESQEYKKGKEIVQIGFEKGVFQKDETNAIYIDLSDKGLDKKYLQRGNGTSIYITQDIALVKQRFEDYHMDRMIYVVGEEQIYHFKVLKYIIEAMKEPFSSDIYHLSYGMVTGKDGTKYKSRFGAAVADQIVDMVVDAAKEQTKSSGKADDLSVSELDTLSEKIGIGALKFAMLKVTARKNMVFDPKEAVDLNGDTGVFIQYCYVRTKSVLKKWEGDIEYATLQSIEKEEENLLLHLNEFSDTLHRSAESLDPSEIALFALDLAKIYNRFYNEQSILKEENLNIKSSRLYLTKLTHDMLEQCLSIMGMPIPERM